MTTINKPIPAKIPPLSAVHEMKLIVPNIKQPSKITIGSVEGLNQALNAKSNIYHQHPIQNIQNLQYVLNNKASVKHSHKPSELESIYPIGTVYSTTSLKTPEELFNFGTWEEIEFSPNKQIKSYQRIA